MLNLDTPILIFALNGELRPAEQGLLARSRWSVSSIACLRTDWAFKALVLTDRGSMVLLKTTTAG